MIGAARTHILSAARAVHKVESSPLRMGPSVTQIALAANTEYGGIDHRTSRCEASPGMRDATDAVSDSGASVCDSCRSLLR